MKLLAVLTTIQSPTACVRTLTNKMVEIGAELIAIGDKKGPFEFDAPATDFVPLKAQLELPYQLAMALPTGHYARKNLGYLMAIERGATCIYETDDDNEPNGLWQPRSIETEARKISSRLWANVYRMFSPEENIWPRGFPLELISDTSTFALDKQQPVESVTCPIQQGLANIAPDVDAVWRLTMDREFYFEDGPSVWLPPGTWCPFNSQTTWWWPVVYPLLYLPSYCSFRMTDIWRSLVAQRCLWELGHGMVFHAAEADQMRNVHNLLRDFEDEVCGYVQNQKIVKALEGLSLQSGESAVSDNLVACYEAMVKLNVIPERELGLVNAWVDDIAGMSRPKAKVAAAGGRG